MVAQNELRDSRERANASEQAIATELNRYDDLVLGEFLGKGAFGEVFVCHLGASSGAAKMAVKFLKGNSSTDSQEEFVKETDFMKKLSHPFVLQFYG